MDFIKENRNLLTALALLAIVSLGFLIHLKLFSQTDYVNGTDGGFYAYKTREMVEEGVYNLSIFSTPSSPPVIFLTSAFFAKFFGVFDGVKITTALYSVLLGVSVFILTQYLTGSRKAGLIAAFLVIFSPLSLRIAADIRKNMVGLFFTPLIIYFILKFFDNPPEAGLALGGWRHILPLAIVGTLGVLSHTSVITIWFVAWAYFAFYFGIKKKLELKEFVPVLATNLGIVILFLLFYDKVASSLEAIAVSPGPIEMPQFERLNEYLLPLAAAAVPGIFLAFGKRGRKEIFLLAWLILSFLLTFSQVASFKEYWRFSLLMFVPVTIFAGYSLGWLFNKSRYLGLLILLAVGMVVTQQFLDFGYRDSQMRPQLNEQALESLEAASNRIEKNRYVYTDAEGHSYFWVRYFFGLNTRRYLEDSDDEINELIGQGEEVYLLTGDFMKPPEEPGDHRPPPMEPNKGMEPPPFNGDNFTLDEKDLFPKDEEVRVLKLTSAEEVSDIRMFIRLVSLEGDRRPDYPGYDFGRFRYLSTYLILPYEIVNIISPPYRPLWQIQLGLPLSLLVIGFAVSLFLKIKARGDLAKFFAIAVGILVVFVIYGLQPPIFWGTREHFEMQPPPMERPEPNLR